MRSPTSLVKFVKQQNFNVRFFEMLESEESREPIRLIDESGYFKWPEIGEWKNSSTGENFYTGAESEGILGKIGYSVRVDGPTERSRRTLLSRFFEGAISTPQGLPEEYVRDWGIPLSSQRLKKMAYSIAWFIRQRKSYERPHYGAIEKWQSDLDYLRSKFYEDFRSRFDWPET
jgi:hypothetical protein